MAYTGSFMSMKDNETMQQETFNIVAELATQATIEVKGNNAYGLLGTLKALLPYAQLELSEETVAGYQKELDEIASILYGIDQESSAEHLSEVMDELYKIWMKVAKSLEKRLIRVHVDPGEIAVRGISR